ncbi:MAG: hypothetical protein LBK47_02035 [Prevotellaceae bacterium]|nr:hypothetical protein [Prevotellaceae bacterium]
MTGDGGSSVPLRFTRNDGAAWGKKVFCGGCAVAKHPPPSKGAVIPTKPARYERARGGTFWRNKE